LLSRLREGEFIYEQPAFPEVEYAFKHALTQEVAYNSVLTERRKALHERTAQAIERLYRDWLEDHYGDLAHTNGILFTSLFLPAIFSILNTYIGLPYELFGILIQIFALQLVLWMSYAIAFTLGGKRTAQVTWLLLFTHLAFIFRSAFILTEYLFMGVLLLALYYLIKRKTFSFREIFTLSVMLAVLTSIRIQGILFALFIFNEKFLCSFSFFGIQSSMVCHCIETFIYQYICNSLGIFS